MDVDARGRRLPIAAGTLRSLARYVLRRERTHRALLSLSFVTRAQIARMNREHLGRRGATDVITFSLGGGGRRLPIIGDIYVAPDVVREQARRYGVAGREELARVVVHGVLHALGRTHPDNDHRTASPMWKRQEYLLAAARREGLL